MPACGVISTFFRHKILRQGGLEKVKNKSTPDAPSFLPAEVMADVPYITLAGDREVTVENYRGIISYDENGAKINTKEKIVKISGEGLVLSHITDEVITVSGKIVSLELV